MLEAVLPHRVTTTKSSLASPPPNGAIKTKQDPYCFRSREDMEFGIDVDQLATLAGPRRDRTESTDEPPLETRGTRLGKAA